MDERDRDRRRSRTPPKGVREQTARESWDEDVTPLPLDTREALTKVDQRVKKSGLETVDRVDLVRIELRNDVRAVDSKVDDLVGHIMRISTQNSELVGQVKILVDDRAVDRQERSALRTETVRTELEIRKTSELADVELHRTRELARVEEQKKARDHRRTIVLKILAGSAVAWGTPSTILLSRGC